MLFSQSYELRPCSSSRIRESGLEWSRWAERFRRSWCGVGVEQRPIVWRMVVYFPLLFRVGLEGLEEEGAGGMGPTAEVVEKRIARPGLKDSGVVDEEG